jgi:xanthine/uracil/vitamin C permease (AzgA family)
VATLFAFVLFAIVPAQYSIAGGIAVGVLGALLLNIGLWRRATLLSISPEAAATAKKASWFILALCAVFALLN